MTEGLALNGEEDRLTRRVAWKIQLTPEQEQGSIGTIARLFTIVWAWWNYHSSATLFQEYFFSFLIQIFVLSLRDVNIEGCLSLSSIIDKDLGPIFTYKATNWLENLYPWVKCKAPVVARPLCDQNHRLTMYEMTMTMYYIRIDRKVRFGATTDYSAINVHDYLILSFSHFFSRPNPCTRQLQYNCH